MKAPPAVKRSNSFMSKVSCNSKTGSDIEEEVRLYNFHIKCGYLSS